MNRTIHLGRIVSIAVFLFTARSALAVTTWTGGGSGTLVTDAANWDNGVPNNSSNPGIVGFGGIVSWVNNYDVNSKGITFTNNAKLSAAAELRPSSAVLTFNNTSQFSVSGGKDLKPWGNSTINLNDTATLSARNIYAYSGGNNRFNLNGDSQVNASGFIDLAQTSGNVFTLAGGRVTASGNFIASASSYFNFTPSSTGVMQRNGINYMDSFTTLITNGAIRINGVVQADINFFIMSYSGGNTTLRLGSAHLPSVAVAPTEVTVVSGSTLTLTATPAGAAPYYFQWYTNGVAIADATSNPLVYPNVKVAGNWSVTMTNAYGSASASSVVTVMPGGTMITFL